MFHRISLSDRDWMLKKQAEDYIEPCDYAFANNFIWQSVYNIEVDEICGCAVVTYGSSEDDGEIYHCFPYGGGDKKAAIIELRKRCHEKGKILRLSPISERDRQFLIDNFPGEFLINPNRDYFDYVYLAENLRELTGKKYQAKRNHIRRFMDNDDWEYENISADNIGECISFEEEWILTEAERLEPGVIAEKDAVMKALKNFEALNLSGGLLRKSGKVVAFTIGEPLNKDTFVVHIEKARPEIQGAYPMINREFVRHNTEGFTYVNREEDTGSQGLRKSKLSYHPEKFTKKYFAMESEFTLGSKEDREDIIALWQAAFGDDREYIEFYLDNRFNDGNLLAIREEGKIVSMINLLPGQLVKGEIRKDALYVYAVATLPEKRGKGYATKLIKFAEEFYEKPLVLKTAEDSLIKFYEGMGFKQDFKRRALKLERADMVKGVGVVLKPADAKTYWASREEKIGEAFSWDREATLYAIKENALCGGETVTINGDFLMYRPDDEGNIKIVETSLNDEGFIEAASLLLEQYKDANKVYMDYGPGMILGDDEVYTGYLGLTLD